MSRLQFQTRKIGRGMSNLLIKQRLGWPRSYDIMISYIRHTYEYHILKKCSTWALPDLDFRIYTVYVYYLVPGI